MEGLSCKRDSLTVEQGDSACPLSSSGVQSPFPGTQSFPLGLL